MIILLTNDDGYAAPGINSLIRPLEEKGHEVWVMAPSGNRSAQSHAMRLFEPLTVTSFGPNRFHNSGTPVDCIMYAAKSRIFPRLPDLVISGINHGYNCSTDVLYSGTCGAASEAVLQGIKGIALSAEPDEDGSFEFDADAAWVADNLEKLIRLCGSESFVNVNFPPHMTSGASATALGFFQYPDVPVVKSEDGDIRVFELAEVAEKRRLIHNGEYCDYHATTNGEVAISVIKVMPEIDEEKQALIKELFS